MAISVQELILLLVLLVVPIWVIALVDILRNDFKGNDKLIWLLAVIFVPFLGPILYFILGRKQKIKSRNGPGNS